VVAVAREQLTQAQPADMDDVWNRFTRNLSDVAIECLDVVHRRSRDWFDENDLAIAELLKRKNIAHDSVLSNPSSVELRERWKQLRSEVQVKLREIENNWWMQRGKVIQDFADNNQMHEFYDAVKGVCGPVRNSTTPIRSANGEILHKTNEDILARWADHFRTLLNAANPADPAFIGDLPEFPQFPEMYETPTIEEVQNAIRQLKNMKSPGPDGVPAEVFKQGGRELETFLHEFFTACWNNEVVPSSWKRAHIVTIYKRKGDKSLCSNSRGISLLDVAGKLFGRILLSRLVRQLADRVLPESQCGFRVDRSTLYMIFVCRQLLEKCVEQHMDFFSAFVDLEKAFDTVPRELLCEVLGRFGCPPRFVNLVRQLHTDTSASVISGGDMSEPFPISVGVKQGCVLAPVLFNIYLVAVTFLTQQRDHDRDNPGVSLRYRTDGGAFKLSRLRARTLTRNVIVTDLQYADDAAVMAHTPQALQNVLTAYDEAYRRVGLKVNAGKTEVLCRTAAPQIQEELFYLNGEALKNVQNFKYLGSVIAGDGTIDQEVTNRVQLANAAFERLRERVFLNKNLKITTIITVYEAVCVSTLLYECETWTVYSRHVRVLHRFHMTSLRRILGISWRDRVTNNDILERAGCGSIDALIARRTLRWAGHVSRMDDSRLPRRVFYGELCGGGRSAGGQRKRFRDHLKKTLKSYNIDHDQFEQLASDRNVWRSAVAQGVECLEDAGRRRRSEQRRRRHEQQQVLPGPGAFRCHQCRRDFKSRAGLLSHQRAHQRRDEARRRRVDGLP